MPLVLQKGWFYWCSNPCRSWLFNQSILSPHHNQRQDEWGGDLDGRMKFLIETYYEIRKQVGEEFPIGLKLNSADFQRGGFTEEESMKVLKNGRFGYGFN